MALCSDCKKNTAVVFVNRIIDGKPNLEGLCLACAKKKGINPLATLELDGTETEFSYIFQVKENNQVKSIFHIYDSSTSDSEDNPTLFHHLKLEKGLWATPWD
jgi:protein-arginine kinase activator protein McsA